MKKILIIEDEEVLSNVLQKKLTLQGYEVLEAKDGEEGMERMRKTRPDLILLDIVMPKKDGFGVLADMRQDPDLVGIPVIIISNSGQPVEIDKALKLGVRDYLVKTEFDPEEVIAKVKKVFGEDSLTGQAGGNGSKKSAKEKNHASSANQSNKILIVEDDRFLRELLAKKLKNENFDIDIAMDGEEGLKKIKEGKPALVLLDLILPGIDGFEVLRQVKKDADEEVRKIPVIILSNLGQRDDVEKGINLGAEDFLIKAHFEPGEIISKIKQVLAAKK